ncbi:MAG TPA: SulP family inorganic anion transporter, partial [Candidatus Obscuribacter sp.]|nr:SulP family inorganic anion transporter [Candidatus Obscuribacter sp.]
MADSPFDSKSGLRPPAKPESEAGPPGGKKPLAGDSLFSMLAMNSARAQEAARAKPVSSEPKPKGGGVAAYGADFLASVVVFLVALPLCMGIAIASGLSPAHGIVTGIIGGIVVGFLGGSP